MELDILLPGEFLCKKGWCTPFAQRETQEAEEGLGLASLSRKRDPGALLGSIRRGPAAMRPSADGCSHPSCQLADAPNAAVYSRQRRKPRRDPMANRKHVDLLRQGGKPWNQWRKDQDDVRPDLSSAKLRGADLHGTDLHRADLGSATLSEADLHRADLSEATLSSAELHRTDLSYAKLSGADLSGADLHRSNLGRARLHGANLHGADLSSATLRETGLRRADLHGADLRGVDLHMADLVEADL